MQLRSTALVYCEKAAAANMPTISTNTSNSIKVNPTAALLQQNCSAISFPSSKKSRPS